MSELKSSLLLFVSIIYFSTQAQRYDSLLSKLNTDYRQEKLYLHFDRSVYNPGETIWFKAYVFAAGYPSQISKTLYAELLDAKGRVIERKTAPILLSGAAASFEIPANINNSELIVRAYTKWMLNFDSVFIYTKAIHITNINGKKITVPVTGNRIAQPETPMYFTQFFPEGGDLVQDIESTIAFKATDAAGMPVKISGNIIDSKLKKITSFTAEHDGMGVFVLQPKGDERYNAVWTDPAGVIHQTLLNPAKLNGVTLETINFPGQVEVTVKHAVAKTTPYPYVYIVAQMNGLLVYRAKVNLEKSPVSTGVIPVQKLPAGILQVTLFTPNEQPIAERLVFINHADHSFTTNVSMALSDTGKRKKNVIQIDVPDTLLSNLSISVTDADVSALHEENIFSSMLLTDDLRGFVYNPAYYFSSEADSVIGHLDLVMMTNGWRRFKWEDMLAGKWPSLHYTPENYISLQGKVTGLKEKLLLNKEVNVIIGLKNDNQQFLITPMLPDGKFILPEMIFYDTAKLFYQFNKDKNKSLTSRATFAITSTMLTDALHFLPANAVLSSFVKPDINILKRYEDIYRQLTEDELRKVKTLKTVVVKVRKKSIEQIKDEEYTSGLFSGGDSRIYLPENDIAFRSSQDVLAFLTGRMAGLQINEFGTEASATMRGERTNFYLNEMWVEARELRWIPMTDVAMIKVFHSPFYGAFRGGNGGAIAVYLKKGAQDPTGLPSFYVRGYSPVKEFYSPDYSTNPYTPEPDFRSTLYWSPFVVTDKNSRHVSITFYNNDITKKMKVVLEGCNENGQLTRVEKVL